MGDQEIKEDKGGEVKHRGARTRQQGAHKGN
jgi:hypothetical protein